MAQKTIYFNHVPVEFIKSPTDLLAYELCGASSKQLKCSFGNIYFQYRKAEPLIKQTGNYKPGEADRLKSVPPEFLRSFI